MGWLGYFVQGAALGLAAAATPGSFQTYLITQTLFGGWRRGVKVAVAPLISDPPIIIITILLLNRLPGQFLQVIGLLGSIFIFYIAWGTWKSWRSGVDYHDDAPGESGSILRRAALINLLSPGPYLYWALVLGPLLLQAYESSAVSGVSFLACFYGTFIGGMIGLAAIFHQTRRLGRKVVNLLMQVCIIILVGFGLLLIWQTLS